MSNRRMPNGTYGGVLCELLFNANFLPQMLMDIGCLDDKSSH